MTDAPELTLEVGKRYVLSKEFGGQTVMLLTFPKGDDPVHVWNYAEIEDTFYAAESLIAPYVEPRPPQYVWLNVYIDEDRYWTVVHHTSKKQADDEASSDRVGCNKVELRAEFDDE